MPVHRSETIRPTGFTGSRREARKDDWDVWMRNVGALAGRDGTETRESRGAHSKTVLLARGM
jgi:hypothetical protein